MGVKLRSGGGPLTCMLFFNAITCVGQGLGLAVPPGHGVIAVFAVFGVVVIGAVVVAIVTFKGRASFRVYAHLLAEKRRAEGWWGRVWEVRINGGGEGGANLRSIRPPGYIPFRTAAMRSFLGGHCPHTGHCENLTQKKHNNCARPGINTQTRPVLQ